MLHRPHAPSSPTVLTGALSALAGFAFRFGNEMELQDGIATALSRRSVSFSREVVLSRRDRIDFMLDEGVGIEVKIDGSISALTRQLFRYAERPEIDGLIVVVSANRLANLPSEINGKPVRCFRILQAFQ